MGAELNDVVAGCPNCERHIFTLRSGESNVYIFFVCTFCTEMDVMDIAKISGALTIECKECENVIFEVKFIDERIFFVAICPLCQTECQYDVELMIAMAEGEENDLVIRAAEVSSN